MARPGVILSFGLVVTCLSLFAYAMPSRRDTPFPLASHVRYHLPRHVIEQYGLNCLSPQQGPRCCPAKSDKAAWEGRLVPFVDEDDKLEKFGVQRCLRDTSCKADAPLMKGNAGQIQPWQKSRVAMVVMRERSISGYAQHTEAVNSYWATKWNYTYISVELAQDVPCERSISWERVEIVRRLLANHEYLFFVDADLVVVEHEPAWFEHIISTYPHADVIACKDSGFVMPDPARGIGGASFANFGAFILRNSPWTHEFIDQWWELGNVHPHYKFGDPHEQAAFGDWYGNRRQANDTAWMSHTVVMETQTFNSLDPFYSTHKKGQPVVHTTMRLSRMRETLFARAHAGLCSRNRDLFLNNTWMESIVYEDAKDNAKKRPDNAEAQMIFAASLQGRGEHDKALPHVEQAVKIRPRDVYYRSALGSAYEKAGRFKEALKQFEKALAPGTVHLQSIVRKRSMLLVKMGKVEKAIKLMEERLVNDPDPFGSYFQLGTTLLKEKKEYEKAVELLQKAVKLAPEHASATLNLGIAYQELRLLHKAVEEFNKVFTLPESEEKEHERAMVAQTRAFIGLNKPREAIDLQEKHSKKYPTSQFRPYMQKLRHNAQDMLNDT